MAVASAAANVFALMKLVDALTLIATLASRGVEVTPEKLSRRYPEVYSLLRWGTCRPVSCSHFLKHGAFALIVAFVVAWAW